MARYFILFLLSFIWASASANRVLVGPDLVVFEELEGKIVCRIIETESNYFAVGALLRQMIVIGAKIQESNSNRSDYTILEGIVGHFNNGAPYAEIPVFMSIDGRRPKLIGMSDANGHFAIRLPILRKEDEVFLYFSGTIDVLEGPRNKDDLWRNQLDPYLLEGFLTSPQPIKEPVLALGSITERYTVNLMTKTEPVAGGDATR